jgi:hypothetical protein
MRKILLFFTLSLIFASCVHETPMGEQWIHNKFNQRVHVFSYARRYNQNQAFLEFILFPNEKFLIARDKDYIYPLNGTDSTIIIFADGKVKTDVYDNLPPSKPVNIYNIQMYNKSDCGRKCTKITYTIDEKDYAEAK